MFPSIQSADEMFVSADSCSAYAAVVNHYQRLSKSGKVRLCRELQSSSDVRTEVLPMVLRGDVFNWAQKAAHEHAVAIRLFLQDVYRYKKPRVLRELPILTGLLHSSPYFVGDLVGGPAFRNFQWSFEMAMDWTVSRQPSGKLGPVLIENDTCAIGGLITLALWNNNLRSHWPAGSFESFLDSRVCVGRLLERGKPLRKGLDLADH
jgi:hypothetical protein